LSHLRRPALKKQQSGRCVPAASKPPHRPGARSARRAVSSNQATGGAAGAGGSAGLGEGGGAYFAAGGSVCLDAFTQAHVKNNHASTSYDDLFGDFTTC